MLFGQFRENLNNRTDEVRRRLKRLVEDLLKRKEAKNEVGDDALDGDTKRLISEIAMRVTEIRNLFEGNNGLIRDYLENLERDVLETLGKQK